MAKKAAAKKESPKASKKAAGKPMPPWLDKETTPAKKGKGKKGC